MSFRQLTDFHSAIWQFFVPPFGNSAFFAYFCPYKNLLKMEIPNYRPRIADNLLAQRLARKGAVVIEGAKWCGKTFTARRQAQSELMLGNPRILAQSRPLAEVQPELLLQGATPRLLDEWQEAPQLWDAVRYEVDQRQCQGQFVLTGSAVPANFEQIRHTGTGRFSWLRMRPMSLFESGDSTGTVSLAAMFDPDTAPVAGTSNLGLEQLCYLICRGGWPQAATMPQGEAALGQARDYYDAVVQFDVSRADAVRRSPLLAQRIMRSYARHLGLQSTLATICADVTASEPTPVSPDTLSSYLNALRKIFVIEDAPAWNPNLRSKTAIRTADTRYFVDPSIAAAAVGAGPGDLARDLKATGMMLETLCVRDLRVYAQPLDGEIYHYRDRNGLECDAVVQLRDGRYGLVEIKLGGETLIEEGASSLLKLASKLDTDRMAPPSFLMLLTGVGPYAYRRPDGVTVVPVGALRP